MIDLSQRAIELRQYGIIKGSRPIFLKIEKGNYNYRGKYVMTIEEEHLHFYQLKFNYGYKGDKDFLVKFSVLDGFRLVAYKENRKRFVLVFKDQLEFTFNFYCGSEASYDNEPNIKFLMMVLKEKGIAHKNNLKGGKIGQKTISKANQWLTQEIRSPKKRGLFK